MRYELQANHENANDEQLKNKRNSKEKMRKYFHLVNMTKVFNQLKRSIARNCVHLSGCFETNSYEVQ